MIFLRLTCFFVSLNFLIPLVRAAEPIKPESEKSLTEQLHDKAEASKSKSDPERAAIMESALADLRTSKIVETAKKAGDQMPGFRLPDVKRGQIDSVELLKKGPLIVVFYRGGWCPYCNLQLHDLQKYLGEIKGLGGELVAISPQTPDGSLSTAQKSELDFLVLSDRDNLVAKKFGLVFKLPKNLQDLYKKFGIDLEKSNGTKQWELPLSASYVVAKNGKISFAFLDADYKKRAESKTLVAELKKLKEKK